MISIRLDAAVAAILLFAATPAAASVSEPPSAVQSVDAQVVDMQDWLGRSGAWSAPYTAMIDRRTERLVALGEGGEQLLSLLNAGKDREARAWAERWAAGQRAGMAAEYEAFSRLPATPPALPATIAMDPALQESARNLNALRDQIGTLLRQTQASGEAYIDLVVAASSGRARDLAALNGGRYTVTKAHLEAEIMMLTATRGPIGEPNYYFSNAMIEANNAAIAWLELNRAIVLGEPFNRATTASRVRQHAALAREAADDMTHSTTLTKQMLDNEPDLVGTPLYKALMPMVESLYRSAELERQIADQNLALAAAVEANDATAQNAVVAKVEVLVTERASEFTRRQVMLAAMQ